MQDVTSIRAKETYLAVETLNRALLLRSGEMLHPQQHHRPFGCARFPRSRPKGSIEAMGHETGATPLGGMLQIRFAPPVPIGAGIGTAGNRHLLATHGMGEGAGAEVGVAAVIRGDHIHAQLQGFCHPPAKAFGAVQGEEPITAAVEGKQLVALEAGGYQMDAGILGGPQLQPMPFGALALGREGFDHQGHPL